MGVRGCIEWYEVEPRIIRFKDPFGYLAHLVVGDSRALLVDSMGGHGNVRECVEAVCDLPVTVVATHSHYDHIMGAWRYEELWLEEREAARLDREEWRAARAHEDAVARGVITGEEPWVLAECTRPEVKLLYEGQVFDLGGVCVEVVALPGHTVGCMGFLVRELGVLFTGDAVTPTMTIFFDEAADLATYRATLAKMSALPFERFYTSHHERTFLRESLVDFDACAAFCETDPGSVWVHSLFSFMTGRIHIYRGTNPESDDFLALIERETDETRERAKRIRAARRAAKRES